MNHRTHETFETTQPWVTYTYGLTHDQWWPLWSSTRILGRARIRATCCVCGHSEVITMRIPRFGEVPAPESGRHPLRQRFLDEHAHPDRGHPMSWALPLRNPDAHPGGLNLEVFGMRLEADMNPEDRR